MPFGKKPDSTGTMVDFDAVYQQLIQPAIKQGGLEPLRADEEMTGGIIHKPMFERLILCEFAVADLTTANANVFYELGLRHAVRPWSTVLLFAEGGRLPFDVAPLRALPYRLTSEGTPGDLEQTKDALVKRLAGALKSAADQPAADSPVYQLVENFPQIDHTKTDVFRERVQYAAEVKERLTKARKAGIDAVREVEQQCSPIKEQEAGVVVDLFLSYRAVKGWKEMIALVDKMSRPLAVTVMIQEQYALALNRDGQGEAAERVLKDVLERRGPSSETYGLLGRVYKDRWESAQKEGNSFLARGFLDKAIDAYLRGFEADWRDAYPGINAVTLMELREPPDPRRNDLVPVVSYAVDRRIATGKPDYWDYATQIELAVLGNNEEKAFSALSDALAAVRESWEPETTGRNIRLIRETRERRQQVAPWIEQVEQQLFKRT
jgi:tetratricopeptide (TPR) repeat protein